MYYENMNWKDIKEKILFSYLGCDWISVDVIDLSFFELLNYINSNKQLKKNKNGVYFTKVSGIKIHLYENDNHHFDFDPKEIDSEIKWNLFLNFFIELSSIMNKKIIFRPEDSNKDENQYYLVLVHPNKKVEYFENAINNYADPNIENR